MQNSDPAPRRWYYSRWFVLLMLFVVAGPFGLPLLWKSPEFNRPLKIIFTLVLLAYTWYLGVATVELLKVLRRQLDALGVTLPV